MPKFELRIIKLETLKGTHLKVSGQHHSTNLSRFICFQQMCLLLIVVAIFFNSLFDVYFFFWFFRSRDRKSADLQEFFLAYTVIKQLYQQLVAKSVIKV